MQPDLGGRRVLITGAARGMGRAMALALLAHGAQVVLSATDRAALDDVAAASGAGERVAIITADLADPAAVRALAADAAKVFGGIDILVNNAGISTSALPDLGPDHDVRFWRISEAMMRRFFEINAIAPQTLAALLAPEMIARGWGRIVNVTTSLNTMLRYSGYGGSKAALEAHTACMAAELAGTGVTANTLLPGGPVDTRMTENFPFPKEAMLRPEKLAAPILYLASGLSDGVTGKRFVAALWDETLPLEAAAGIAGAPVAWTGYGVQAMAAPKA